MKKQSGANVGRLWHECPCVWVCCSDKKRYAAQGKVKLQLWRLADDKQGAPNKEETYLPCKIETKQNKLHRIPPHPHIQALPSSYYQSVSLHWGAFTYMDATFGLVIICHNHPPFFLLWLQCKLAELHPACALCMFSAAAKLLHIPQAANNTHFNFTLFKVKSTLCQWMFNTLPKQLTTSCEPHVFIEEQYFRFSPITVVWSHRWAILALITQVKTWALIIRWIWKSIFLHCNAQDLLLTTNISGQVKITKPAFEFDEVSDR